jgi:hypothetical protein
MHFHSGRTIYPKNRSFVDGLVLRSSPLYKYGSHVRDTKAVVDVGVFCCSRCVVLKLKKMMRVKIVSD